jgi:transcriptional regulator with XRE-family HTH domain
MARMNKMRALRHKLTLTQEEFAEALGTSQSTVSRWETEGLSPTLDDLRIMVQKFGNKVDVTQMLGL